MTEQTPKVEKWMEDYAEIVEQWRPSARQIVGRLAKNYEPEAKRVQGLVKALEKVLESESEADFYIEQWSMDPFQVAREALDEYQKGA